MTTATERVTHTPGPWRVEPWTYNDGIRTVATIQTDTDAIAQVLDLWCPDERSDEREANARLIAAAPELLEALRTTLDALYNETTGNDSHWIKTVKEQAKAALALVE